MSGVIVYGDIISQPTRSVVNFCKLSNIQFTFHDIPLFTEANNTKEFIAINPFQSIPAITHDGYNVWESAAEVVYLAEAFNVDNQWYPKDARLRARINAYLHWHHQNTREPLLSYLVAKILSPKFFGGAELTPETEAPYKEKMKNFFETLTWLLSETRYIARTPTATIADIFAFNEISTAMGVGLDMEPFPAVKTWFAEIGAIPEVAEALAQAQEAIKKKLG